MVPWNLVVVNGVCPGSTWIVKTVWSTVLILSMKCLYIVCILMHVEWDCHRVCFPLVTYRFLGRIRTVRYRLTGTTRLEKFIATTDTTTGSEASRGSEPVMWEMHQLPHLESPEVRDSLHSLIVCPLSGWEWLKKQFSCCHMVVRLRSMGMSPPWKFSSTHNSSIQVSDSHVIGETSVAQVPLSSVIT